MQAPACRLLNLSVMPLLFKDLPEELNEQYVCGKCMYLAAALHRRFGFPIEVCVEVPGTPHAYVGHAWVVDPATGDVIDIDGQYPASANGWLHPAAEHRQGLDEKDLFALITSTCYQPFEDGEWEQAVADAQAVIDQHLFVPE